MADSQQRSHFNWRQVRVAALVVVGILLLMYGVYRIGAVLDVFAERYELVTFVPSALGLREGAPVTLAGQQIGQVASIEFIPVERKRNDNHLRIVLAVSEEVHDQIRSDSRAFMRTQGLLGDKFIDIEPGSANAAILASGDTLISGKSVDIDQFLTQASDMMDVTMAIIGDVRDMTTGLSAGEGTMGMFLRDDELYTNMVGATGELRSTLSGINRSDGTFGRLLRDPVMYNRLTSAVTRIDSIGSIILYGNGSVSKLIRTDSLYRSIAGAATSADSAMATAAAMIERLANGQGTLQKMMTDPALYDALLKAMVDLQTLINDVRQEPGRYAPPIDVHVFGGPDRKQDQ